MGKKAAKSTKKFSASGQLRKTIDARRKHQKIKKRIAGKKDTKGKQRAPEPVDDNDDNDDEEVPLSKDKGKKRMTVDDFLEGGFMDRSDDDDDDENLAEEEEEEESDGEEFADDASFASVDDLEEGAEHMIELSKLAEKDPEFYQYLKENDQELLNFNADDEDEMEDEDDSMGQTPVLTKAILQNWQKALLEARTLSLRKLLVAFRSAAHMNEDNQVLAWSIDSSAVYNKLVTTALKYTPVILEHHAPTKTLPNGKFKPPTQTPTLKGLQKLILSYFQNVIHILSQLTDSDMLQLAVAESAKIVPYIMSSRKAVKLYLKKCLELWSSAADNVRIAAFLAIRKLASSADESILDNVLKVRVSSLLVPSLRELATLFVAYSDAMQGTYTTLVRSTKNTSVHTLPSINLMKNSGSEVFMLDQGISYQHAFGYIRQLAIHLRNSMKVKSKEAYKLVYNWQYIHCIDFWSVVLARACDAATEAETGKESELKPLIYPLVQVSLGAIKLIPNSRSYPFHLHIVRSLLHLTRHTHTYVPLAPYLVPILVSTLSTSGRSKASTLRPLDLEVQIRAPAQYAKTRIYADGLVEEASFLLADWLASSPVHGSVAFPEIVVPVTVALRKAIKAAAAAGKGKSSTTKDAGAIKSVLERVEESARWVEQRRRNVEMGPNKMDGVREWERGLVAQLDESPLGKYLKIQRKTREKRRKLVDKARQGEDEILEEDD
ncbi:Noc2-domain-containing protein [Mycena chlorophos]|uniref:Noc2-domain-containing protein n=1 Tax=Mycena chlorophos TaxID=658473 RepID=A0A8H6TQC9_MYCCL|nr:Noc2-domain-containing protein [Mycena chlorophos]